MIVPQSYLLPDLAQSALWLVIDPFDTQPSMANKSSPPEHVDAYNNAACIKISYYLEGVTHKFVRLLPNHRVNCNLETYPRMNSHDMLTRYMEQNGLTRIVYCGFHYGVCVHNTNIGIAAMHKEYECFLKHDLCFVFPDNNTYAHQTADKLTQQYGTIIV